MFQREQWTRRVLAAFERLLLRHTTVPPAPLPAALPDWVGGRLELWVEPPTDARRLVLEGQHHAVGDQRRPLHVRLFLWRSLAAEVALAEPGAFRLEAELSPALPAPLHVLVEAQPCFVPDRVLRNGDSRELAFVLCALDARP